jgi:hypothetical protein
MIKLSSQQSDLAQVNLIVGDYFKVDKGFLRWSKQATELITWLRSKTYVLALIREVQLQNGITAAAVICAVLTRWTAHYLAYSRLIQLSPTLKLLVQQDEMRATPNSRLITGDKKAKEKARRMVKLIKNEVFWKALVR